MKRLPLLDPEEAHQMAFGGLEFAGTTGLLFYALGGKDDADGLPDAKADPLASVLRALAGDAEALAVLADASENTSVQRLAPALDNLQRRLWVLAELVTRERPESEEARESEEDQHGEIRAHKPRLALPAPATKRGKKSKRAEHA